MGLLLLTPPLLSTWRRTALTSVLIFSGSLSVMSVVMKPGATALTVMLREASSRVIVRVQPMTPALLAE